MPHTAPPATIHATLSLKRVDLRTPRRLRSATSSESLETPTYDATLTTSDGTGLALTLSVTLAAFDLEELFHD